MGSCIICGSSVEGRICDLHEEDVVFEFRGSSPDELTRDRYYRGTVDGYAEFGVFVDIGDSVTGLLHKSELDQRLDSLDWEPGDTVYAQVKNVRDNGNVDLGWSIRQDEGAFRGTLIDDPNTEGGPTLADEGNPNEGATEGGTDSSDVTPDSPDSGSGDGSAAAETAESEPATPETAASETAEADANDGGRQVAAGSSGGGAVQAAPDQSESAPAESGSRGAPEEVPRRGGEDGSDADADEVAEEPSTAAESTPTATRESLELTVDELDDNVGELVRLEGEIVEARQTSGPTVFTLRDETGTVECAAFESAGVRAYPEVGEADVVRLEGEVERRRGDLQVETEALVLLEDDERSAVAERMEDAMVQRARPEAVDPLADDPAVASATDGIRDVATAIRRAVIEGRPVVVRHSTTTDGYVAGVALERATLPLVREEHQSADAEYHYFDRRPLEGSIYDLADATKDVTSMLSNRERHDEALPLFVFVGVGGSEASLDAFDLLDVYDARRVVIDHRDVADAVVESVDTVATPVPEEAPLEVADEVTEEDVTPAAEHAPTTATALAATTAAAINEAVADDLAHLPAVSFWQDAPAAYVDLAAEAGFDEETVRDLRESVALEAFYQSYEDKRELIIDLLFPDDEAEGLAAKVAEQFREKLTTEVETAEANLEEVHVDGGAVLVLDTEAFTHRYEFPPVALLLDEIWRRNRDEAVALLGMNTDEGHLRTDEDVDVDAMVTDAAMGAPRAGIEAVSPRDGEFEYLAGEREEAQDAILDALGSQL
jgi:RecJ-like exonuclease